jgi:hypothetical protein
VSNESFRIRPHPRPLPELLNCVFLFMPEDSVGLGDIIVQCLIVLCGQDSRKVVCLQSYLKTHLSNQNASIQQNIEKLQMSA